MTTNKLQNTPDLTQKAIKVNIPSGLSKFIEEKAKEINQLAGGDFDGYVEKNSKLYGKSMDEFTGDLDVLKQSGLEAFNFRIDSTGWEEKEGKDQDGNIVKIKVNPEGDVTEYIDGEAAGEQLFTFESMNRETKKAGKRVPTDEYFNEIKKKIGSDPKIGIEKLGLSLAGYRDTDGSTFGNRGRSTLLWSSTTDGNGAYGRSLFRTNSTVRRLSRDVSYGFSVRCIKD